MNEPYPYVPSSGPITTTINKFRSKLPSVVTAETLKKLGLAPNNEATVIYLLKFLKLIDDEGKITSTSQDIFYKSDEDFKKELSKVIKGSYQDLFDTHGEGAWNLDKTTLTNYFRVSDQSSELVGTRKAITFQTLSGLAGQTSLPEGRAPKNPNGLKQAKADKVVKDKNSKPKTKPEVNIPNPPDGASNKPGNFGLTVRIEVNLPAGGDKETYDHIFKSIRENLIDVG